MGDLVWLSARPDEAPGSPSTCCPGSCCSESLAAGLSPIYAGVPKLKPTETRGGRYSRPCRSHLGFSIGRLVAKLDHCTKPGSTANSRGKSCRSNLVLAVAELPFSSSSIDIQTRE